MPPIITGFDCWPPPKLCGGSHLGIEED